MNGKPIGTQYATRITFGNVFWKFKISILMSWWSVWKIVWKWLSNPKSKLRLRHAKLCWNDIHLNICIVPKRVKHLEISDLENNVLDSTRALEQCVNVESATRSIASTKFWKTYWSENTFINLGHCVLNSVTCSDAHASLTWFSIWDILAFQFKLNLKF